MAKYKEIDLFEDDGEFYLAKHPDHPLIELSEGFPYIRTTEKTKRKHIEKLLDDDSFTEGLARLCNISQSELTEALEEEIGHVRAPSTCPYRRFIGPHVYKALGGYDHPFRATLGVWFTEAQLLTAVFSLIPAILTGSYEQVIPALIFYNVLLNSTGLVFAKQASKMKEEGEPVTIY
jgi:hypothetical protein